MSDEWTKLILEEMKRFDMNHRDVMGELGKQNEKFGEYNGTLNRLTSTVEHHVKRSDLADKERKELKTQVGHIEGEVEGLKLHVDETKGIIEDVGIFVKVLKFTFSTRGLKWSIAMCGLITAFFGAKYAIKEYKSAPDHKAKSK